MKIVVGLGEVLWDLLPQGKQMGGAPINFAYHASRLGHQACSVSAVGCDSLGQELIECLKRKRMDIVIPQTDYPTGTVQVTLDGNGIPQYHICRDVAWDYIPYTDRMDEIARRTDAVCFGSLAQRSAASRETIYRYLDAMSESDCTWKIFDVNLRQHFYDREVLRESLNRCNVLKINDEELPIVSSLLSVQGEKPEEQCFDLLRQYSLRMVIYTCGIRGSYVYTLDSVSFAETPCVEVADTVGAGDSFTGAFAGALLNGKSMREAHQIAVRVSAYVCTQHGAMPDVPSALFE